MATMKAIGVKDDKGPLENLFIDEIPRPKIDHAKALVKVRAFGLNRMDLMQREGKYPLPPQAPKTMGVEFSGTVEELAGESEKGFKKGDAVFGLAYGGAYAEYISVSTHMLVHKPEELSWEQCAAIPEVWITALQAMYLIGEFSEGKSILWHAGASNVSIAGIQLSKHNGASAVYATARSDDKTDFCVRELGATAAYNTKSVDWADEVLKATNGNGVDIIIDFIGPSELAKNLRAAAKDAKIVSLACLGGANLLPEHEQPNFLSFFAKRIRFEGSGLRSRDEAYQGKLRDQLVEHALPKFKDGSFKPHIEKVFAWEKIQEAHGQMERNETKGKLVCTIP
ncbi:hypothetical protein LTR95_003770 [Oleoguttula sp. CCFEE 5521]